MTRVVAVVVACARAVVVCAAFVALASCQFFVGVTPCLDDHGACPHGSTCDTALGICTAGKPAPPPASSGSCGAPIPFALGVQATGDTTGVTSEFKNGICDFGGGDAGELVFSFTIDHDAHIRAVATPTSSTYDVEVYARIANCADPFSEVKCADEPVAGAFETIEFDAHAGDVVFLIVDGFQITDVGPFTLDAHEVIDEGGACDPTNTATLCREGSRCAADTCAPIAGDTCDTAVRLAGTSGHESEDTSSMVSDMVVDDTCVAPFAYTSLGPDMFYVVNLAAGAAFDATLTPLATTDQGLYVQATCPPPSDGGCVTFSDAGGAGVAEPLHLVNSGAAALDFFIVVDSFTADPAGVGRFILDWTITTP